MKVNFNVEMELDFKNTNDFSEKMEEIERLLDQCRQHGITNISYTNATIKKGKKVYTY